MPAAPSHFVATKRVDAETMIKRLFKVADLLSHHMMLSEDLLDENERQKCDFQEIEYCETRDPFNST
jgi:hypothetical protein